MIKKVQRKIIAIIAIILWIMLILTLGIINVYSYRSTRNNVYISISRKQHIVFTKYLKKTGQWNVSSASMSEGQRGLVPEMTYQASSAVFASDGTLLYSQSEDYTRGQMDEIGTRLWKTRRIRGYLKPNYYRVKKQMDGSTQVTFLNYDSIIAMEKRLFYISIAIAVGGMILSYIVARKISVNLLQPIKDNMNRQHQFVSNASHELRTPLAVISANVTMIEHGHTEPKYLQYIRKEITKMKELTSELLTMASIDSYDRQKYDEVFSLSDVIEGSALPFESMAYERHLKFDINVDPDIGFVGVKDQMGRLAGTLIENAFKHVSKGGRISVILHQRRTQIKFTVTNTGETIPKEEQEKIFERFYQSDKSDNRGFGLGLSIAKTIVENHGGSIRVYSEHGITSFECFWNIPHNFSF